MGNQKVDTDALLKTFKQGNLPTADEFKNLVLRLDNHQLLAKVFMLEGTPFVFKESPMKYVVFKEQVADQFEIGSQDVCIVGSARLGFSPSPHKFGTSFSETSDVDVVIVSFDLFDRGQRQLFSYLNQVGPTRGEAEAAKKSKELKLDVNAYDWADIRQAIRNYTYQNFNPGLLPVEDVLSRDIFEKISSTAGLFLALEPQVFVSKIRTRIFRDWRAAEAYYTNSLRELKRSLNKEAPDDSFDQDDEDSSLGAEFRARPVTK